MYRLVNSRVKSSKSTPNAKSSTRVCHPRKSPSSTRMAKSTAGSWLFPMAFASPMWMPLASLPAWSSTSLPITGLKRIAHGLTDFANCSQEASLPCQTVSAAQAVTLPARNLLWPPSWIISGEALRCSEVRLHIGNEETGKLTGCSFWLQWRRHKAFT